MRHLTSRLPLSRDRQKPEDTAGPPWYLSPLNRPPTTISLAEPTPDRLLLERLRTGDEAAFEAIFRGCYPRLVAAAEHLLRDQARAEDAVQEVLLELWRGRERLDPEMSVAGYLHRAVRNRALNQLRHDRVVRQAEPLVEPGTPPPGADSGVLTRELEQAVRAAVSRLPERCREVFELSRVHQLRYAEIASAMEISVKTVEAQMGKAIRMLRDGLGGWLPEGEDPGA